VEEVYIKKELCNFTKPLKKPPSKSTKEKEAPAILDEINAKTYLLRREAVLAQTKRIVTRSKSTLAANDKGL